ncbi:hypothetical protein FNF31_07856 [Cafeteria roenbergensis]|uniref:Cyclin N-terminal domain-containing protein n=1 Tax=Cafeteria roenbergensis TaxID=33653 RepID=A0A5A8BZ81_CAFRO|nr:hypothetical protein FNF31_07856 [Cafeteria roenbergensis]
MASRDDSSIDMDAHGDLETRAVVREETRAGVNPTDEALNRVMGASVEAMQANLREIEMRGKMHNPDAKWLLHRRGMVDWICEACETYRLARTTAHVACEMMDRFCAVDEVPTHRLALVSLAAIQIAAKYEEQEEDVPPVRELIKRSGHPIPEAQLHQMEVLMLTAADWCCTAVTPMHFVTLLASRGVVFPDDVDLSGKHRSEHVGRFMDFFADLCCQDYAFAACRPSAVAGAIVLASRRALRFRNVWHARLPEVLDASVHEVAAVFFQLWAVYKAQFGDEVTAIDAEYARSGVHDNVHWLRHTLESRPTAAPHAAAVRSSRAAQPPPPGAFAAQPPPVHANPEFAEAAHMTGGRVDADPALKAVDYATPATAMQDTWPLSDASQRAQARDARRR